jgi:hypothetical protein
LGDDNLIKNFDNWGPLGKSDHAVLLVSLQESVDIRVQERLNYGKGDYKSLEESFELELGFFIITLQGQRRPNVGSL